MARNNRTPSAVFLALFLGGCAYSAESSVPAAIPNPQIPYTNSWSAETGIDLFSRGAELVRASFEAGHQTSNYTFDDSFPGYREALGYPDNADRDITLGVQTENTERLPVGEFTVHYYITELIESPTDVTASVCEDIVYAEPKTYERPTRHGFSWTVSLRNTAQTPGLPSIVDTDPDTHDPRAKRIPDWNVFGTWEIVRLTHQGLNTEKNIAEPACTAWWLDNHPDTLEVAGNFTFRTRGVTPGTPRAPQYPEWIGPSQP